MKFRLPVRRQLAPSVSALIEKSERCAEFQKFCAEFENWGVQCWLKAKEKALHFGVGAFNAAKARTVELGKFEGASALFTMAGMRFRGAGGVLYSVDPHLGAPPFLGSAPWQFTLDKFRSHVAKAGLAAHLKSVVSDSQIASSIWPALPINSLLIDADHSYNGCLRDVECWAVKLRPGGFMLIDDAEDPALPELLQLIEDLKEMKSLCFEELVEGIAVFRRTDSDAFVLLNEIRDLRHLSRRRPWDMEFIQRLKPNPSYRPERLSAGNDLLTAYQLGYLARCEPGNYAVSSTAPASDTAIADALVEARRDGIKVVADPSAPSGGPFRMVICSVAEAAAFMEVVLPGGVLICRSSLSATYENSISERQRLLDAGFEGCGWSGQIHWAFARPHFLSTDAILAYIELSMS